MAHAAPASFSRRRADVVWKFLFARSKGDRGAVASADKQTRSSVSEESAVFVEAASRAEPSRVFSSLRFASSRLRSRRPRFSALLPSPSLCGSTYRRVSSRGEKPLTPGNSPFTWREREPATSVSNRWAGGKQLRDPESKSSLFVSLSLL